jgi:DNA-binding NarL/FixJ family response regulator
MFSIAIVDDMKLFRESLIASIKPIKSDCVFYQYVHGKDFIDRFHHEYYRPNIVLMDISMPIMNGYDTMRWLHSYDPSIPVLVVSFIEKDSTIIKMYHHGAKGFITKNIGLPDLLKAIDTVASGQLYFNVDGITTSTTTWPMRRNGKDITIDNIPLTDTEEAILTLLCSDKSISEIARDSGRSIATIETHKANIARKTGIHTRQGLFLLAVEMGLVCI